LNFVKKDRESQEFPPDKATGDLCDSIKGRCIDASPDGKSIAVGFKDGHVKVYIPLSFSLLFASK
jgi:hypothetical protein